MRFGSTSDLFGECLYRPKLALSVCHAFRAGGGAPLTGSVLDRGCAGGSFRCIPGYRATGSRNAVAAAAVLSAALHAGVRAAHCRSARSKSQKRASQKGAPRTNELGAFRKKVFRQSSDWERGPFMLLPRDQARALKVRN